MYVCVCFSFIYIYANKPLKKSSTEVDADRCIKFYHLPTLKFHTENIRSLKNGGEIRG